MPKPDGPQWRYTYQAPNPHNYQNEEHIIRAATPEGREIGRLRWWTVGGAVSDVAVSPNFRRRGVATGMWNEAYRLNAQDPDIVSPSHSSSRTDEGDAWARSVGGELPERDEDY